ncbi:T-cell acute lymphocytic leukemia protein 1 [Acropora cervicornis]|uniref:T-cell acute lymphocytic leukemia protein 1 n=1 Tax=Acropora cervicornis TaxID=6130 RepID=A0AAD9PUN4_ACRCE|nr:T-cell acute lymphocytic leukemia protein 1 [Acropora cervicornis]KAK2549249.1 T-cell acute lymphocytic leukemia protein 1 [Acropora cervicornis]
MEKTQVKEWVENKTPLNPLEKCQSSRCGVFSPSIVETNFVCPNRGYDYLGSINQLDVEQNTFATMKRERWRQKNVNMAFSDLRRLLPTYPPDRKLSKVDILRTTIKYIRFLVDLLKTMDGLERDKGDQSNCLENIKSRFSKHDRETGSNAEKRR